MVFNELYEKCMREFATIKGRVNNLNDYAEDIRKRTEIRNEKVEKLIVEPFYDKYMNFYEYLLKEFGNVEFFKDVIERMKNSPIRRFENIDYKMNIINEFYLKVKSVILLYETTVNPDAENISLKIKIPKTDSITELKKYIDSLDFVITKCPFLQSDEASLKLEAVDNGSIWLLFGVAGASVAVGSVLLNNIAAFIDKCFVIKSHKLTCKRQEQEIRDMEIEQTEKEELLKSANKLYKIGVKYEIKELEKITGYNIQDGDEMGRVEQSFERMVKMLDQGLQIYTSISAPEETKALFAPLEMHYLTIQKDLERIEKKSDTKQEIERD